MRIHMTQGMNRFLRFGVNKISAVDEKIIKNLQSVRTGHSQLSHNFLKLIQYPSKDLEGY